MKSTLFTTLLLTAVHWAVPTRAENITHTRQLMSTRQCQNCDLAGAGLVRANLSGADLVGVNLSTANLTSANLSNANLQGANLISVVFHSANLSGADLSGADLRGADLRNAYLINTNLEGANLQGANLRGAIGLTSSVVSASDYYQWGIEEAQKQNFNGAIGYYNQALEVDPEFANVYLARGGIQYRLRNVDAAIADAEKAAQIFAAQNDTESEAAALQLVEGIKETEAAAAKRKNGGSSLDKLVGAVGGVSSLLLRFLF
ncbi:MAG: tetratricopeptide repeat protein [Cyanothece sp. SIO1E1]|nr:tetratricopeptide repeat protein [Cyanothece sp. SIO1E1]